MKRFPDEIRCGDTTIRIAAARNAGGGYTVRLGDETFEFDARSLGSGRFVLRDQNGGRTVASFALDGEVLLLRVGGRNYALRASDRGHDREHGEDDPTIVTAPMTGTIVKVLVREGDSVAEGNELIVLSAMKLCARTAGTVAEVVAREGATVDAGSLLLRIESEAAG